MDVSVQRIGGGSYGWLALYAALLLGAVVGLARVCVGAKEAVESEAQDTAILLARAMGDERLTETTAVRFVKGAGLVWDGVGSLHHRQELDRDGKGDGDGEGSKEGPEV